MTLRRLDEANWVSGQITPEDVPALARDGVTVLVNNRPDYEEPGQPLAGDIEAAAERAGLAYRFVPIIRGIGPADVDAMRQAIRDADGGKLLAFCRSGNRSALAWAVAMREEGMASEDVERRLHEAGIDSGPIAHLL